MATRKSCGAAGTICSVTHSVRRVLAAGCLACAALWASWLGSMHMAGHGSLLDRAEAVSVDLRLLVSGPLPPPAGVVIVAIDDATVNSEGQYPLNRARLAELINHIRKAGARGLAVDLLLLNESNPDADQDLEAALAAMPSVIAAAGLFDHQNQNSQPLPVATDVLRPLKRFGDVAQVGLVNIATDAGGTPRHVPLIVATPSGPEPTLALRAAGLSVDEAPSFTKNGVRIAGKIQPLDLGWHLPLRPYGSGEHIATISALTLLNNNVREVDLQGKLVVIGATAVGVGDRFSTAYDPIMPGVEVLATAIANLTETTALIRDKSIRRIDTIVALGLSIVIVSVLFLLPLTVGTALSIVLLASWLFLVGLLFSYSYWLSAVLPLAACLPPAVLTILIRQSIDRRHTKSLAIAGAELSRFQAPALAQIIAKDPSFLSVPLEQQAAILFIDLSGFTGLGERLGPADTRTFLKDYHTKIVEVCSKHSGVVLDFMGDGAMVGFGIPQPGPKDAQNALTAAFDLAQALNIWIKGSDASADISGLRIGVHYGPVILSRLGHDSQQQIAATGDCVNVASRLMDVGKDFEALITVSIALLEASGNTVKLSAPFTKQHVELRGRQQGIAVALWRAADLPNDA